MSPSETHIQSDKLTFAKSSSKLGGPEQQALGSSEDDAAQKSSFC